MSNIGNGSKMKITPKNPGEKLISSQFVEKLECFSDKDCKDRCTIGKCMIFSFFFFLCQFSPKLHGTYNGRWELKSAIY